MEFILEVKIGKISELMEEVLRFRDGLTVPEVMVRGENRKLHKYM